MAKALVKEIIPSCLPAMPGMRRMFTPILWIDGKLTTVHEGAHPSCPTAEGAKGSARRLARSMMSTTTHRCHKAVLREFKDEAEEELYLERSQRPPVPKLPRKPARKPTFKRIHIPVTEIEFEDGGTTIWVHGPQGGTVLRIKCASVVGWPCTGPIAHADIQTDEAVSICIPRGTKSCAST